MAKPKKDSAAVKAAKTRKRRAAAKKAVVTRNRRTAAKKAAGTRRSRRAGDERLSINFKNGNGMPITLYMEAPKGTKIYGPSEIPSHGSLDRTYDAAPNLYVEVSIDPDHGTDKGTFSAQASPQPLLRSVELLHRIGGFKVKLTASN
ncbi:MAG: hypothetical protein Q8K93_02290 [Reyranella sp.]|uniref:hypothetical protein n=1 Tax=Reyranella sp. TaxID=1929291 RepID=UPI00272FC223|nr:hypothetical protein [Reyranella sp.]MDP1961010.1 hypothetical protein [Reyranella sp.]MDP2376244.1 hypothetical protein [Reyranella sp.]